MSLVLANFRSLHSYHVCVSICILTINAESCCLQWSRAYGCFQRRHCSNCATGECRMFFMPHHRLIPILGMDANPDRYRRCLQCCWLSSWFSGVCASRRSCLGDCAAIPLVVPWYISWLGYCHCDLDVSRTVYTSYIRLTVEPISANMPDNLAKYLPGVPAATITKLYGSIRSARTATPEIRAGVIQGKPPRKFPADYMI